MVAHYLPVPEGCDFAYAETVRKRGETTDRQSNDAGANLQAAHCRQVAADGEICDQEDRTLFRAKEESNFARIRAYVRVEFIQDNRQAGRFDVEYIQKDREDGERTQNNLVSYLNNSNLHFTY